MLDSGLNTLHVPYSYGFSIILLTLLVKVATFPLTKKQASPPRPLTCARRSSSAAFFAPLAVEL